MQSFPEKLESETTGDISDAEHALLLALQTYIAHTSSEGLTKLPYALGLVQEKVAVAERGLSVLVYRNGDCLDMLIAPAFARS
jgi:hypothetical protein